MKSTRIRLSLLPVLFCCASLGAATLNSSRILRQSPCQDKFQCDGGVCIEKTDICNGLPQCSDKSDESVEACDCGTIETGLSSRSSGNAPGVSDAKIGFHPWLVGVHRSRNRHIQLLCLGTLIYDNIVLTSANCIYDPELSSPYHFSLIFVSIGKLKRDFKVDEHFQQTFRVTEIRILDRYEGDTKGYARNLAIIKLSEKIKRTDYVRPICLWDSKHIPQGTKLGIITGWGLQFEGNYAMNLREAKVQLHDISECIRKFYDPLYKRFLTNDKFCLTFDMGVGLRDIDTGGPVSIYYNSRYYLLGVLSLNRSGTDFGIATAVGKYIPWIQNTTYNLKKLDSCLDPKFHRCSSGLQCIKPEAVCDNKRDCSDGSDESVAVCSRLSKPPSNHTGSCAIPDSYEIFTRDCEVTGSCQHSGSWAPHKSAYKVTCSEGRGFSRSDETSVTVICYEGKWVPSLANYKCLPMCKGMNYKSLQLKCLYLGSEISCDKPVKPDTVIEIACKRSYKRQESVHFVNNTICLRDGSIRNIIAECAPVCGKPYTDNSQILISNGTKLKSPKYPWHMALYWKKPSQDSEDYIYQCGGTLIDSNKVLTAGHCIWDSSTNTVVDAKLLRVVNGKLYSSYKIYEAAQQVADVAKIIKGNYYNGAKTKHGQDIAVLILSHDLELSYRTMPACLDLDLIEGGVPIGAKGHIVGWGRLNEKDSEPSQNLMETWLHYLDLNSCLTTYKNYSFDEYLQADKYCVVYDDGSGTQAGDSGGGMTFLHGDLHYVYGIVSIKKPNQDHFAAFTNVTSHRTWLKNILNQNKN